MSTKRFDDKGFLGLALSFAAVLLVATICKLLSMNELVTQASSAVAAGVPAAAFRLQRRSGGRDPGASAAPRIGSIMAIVGAVVLLYDTIVGMVSGFVGGYPALLLSLGSIAAVFLLARALSSTLGDRPYAALAVGFALAFTARMFVAFVLFRAVVEEIGDPASVFMLIVVYYALMFAAAAAGVAAARRPTPTTQPGAGWVGPGAATNAPRPPAAAQPPLVPPTPPAGWYPDPQLRGVVRWWDGRAWTEHRRNG